MAGVTYPHFLIAVIAVVSRCMNKFIGKPEFLSKFSAHVTGVTSSAKITLHDV
jgi:hypothetical protein